MKQFLITILFAMLSVPAFAAIPSALTCNNHSEESDASLQASVDIVDGQLTIAPPQSLLSINLAETVSFGNTIAIIEKTIDGIAYDEEYRWIVNALLVYNPITKRLNVTVWTGGPELNGVELVCTKPVTN